MLMLNKRFGFNSPNKKEEYLRSGITKASAVKVTKADGTTFTVPAFRSEQEMNAKVYTKRSRYGRSTTQQRRRPNWRNYR